VVLGGNGQKVENRKQKAESKKQKGKLYSTQ
jgi:hypothetical protein